MAPGSEMQHPDQITPLHMIGVMQIPKTYARVVAQLMPKHEGNRSVILGWKISVALFTDPCFFGMSEETKVSLATRETRRR